MSTPSFLQGLLNPVQETDGNAPQSRASFHENVPALAPAAPVSAYLPVTRSGFMTATTATAPQFSSETDFEWTGLPPPPPPRQVILPREMMPQPHPNEVQHFPPGVVQQSRLGENQQFHPGVVQQFNPDGNQQVYQHSLLGVPQIGRDRTLPMGYPSSPSRPLYPSELTLVWQQNGMVALPKPSPTSSLFRYIQPALPKTVPTDAPSATPTSALTPTRRVVETVQAERPWTSPAQTAVLASSISTLSIAPAPSIGPSSMDQAMGREAGSDNVDDNGEHEVTQAELEGAEAEKEDDDNEEETYDVIHVSPFKQESEDDSTLPQRPKPTRRGRGGPRRGMRAEHVPNMPLGHTLTRTISRRHRGSVGRRMGRDGPRSSGAISGSASTSPAARRTSARWSEEEAETLSTAYRRCLADYFTDEKLTELCPRRTASASRQQMRKMGLFL